MAYKIKNKPLKEKKSYSVENLEKKKDLLFVSDEESVKAIKEQFGKKAENYDSFFVRVEDGYYKETYGMQGKVPLLNKKVEKI